MKTSKLQVLSILTASALALPLSSIAQTTAPDKSPSKPAASPPSTMAAGEKGEKEAKDKPLPFKGKIASADPTKKTFTIESKKEGGGRTFTVTGDSKLMKGANETASWDDLTVGQEVRGSYKKAADGTLQIVKLSVGAKEEGAEKPKKEKTEKMEKKKE
jgi:Domain of unknown function (DUF5666)